MNGNPKNSRDGFICPIKNCKKRETTLYSLTGLCTHLQINHPRYLEKTLKLQRGHKYNRKIEIQVSI